MRKYIVTIFIPLFILGVLFCHITAIGQGKIDSLLSVLKSIKTDTGKVNTLNALSYSTLENRDSKNAIKYANDAYILAETINFKKGQGEALYRVALTYAYERKRTDARKYYIQALKIFEEIKDLENIVLTNLVYGNFLMTYYFEYADAIKYFDAARKLIEKTGEKKTLASIYSSLANAYSRLGGTGVQEAIRYDYLILKIHQEFKDSTRIAGRLEDLGTLYQKSDNFQNAFDKYSQSLQMWKVLGLGYTNQIIRLNTAIGNLFSQQSNWSEALKYHKEALRYYQEVLKANRNPERFISLLPIILNNIGSAYEAQATIALADKDEINAEKKIDSAIQNYSAALTALEASPNKRVLATVYLGLGNLFSRLNSYDLAKDYLEKSLRISKDTNFVSLPLLHYSLFKIDSAQGNYQKALEHYTEYTKNLRGNSFANGLNERMEYQFMKKEDSLNFQQQLTNGRLKQQQLVAVQQQQQLKINEASLALSIKQKELNELALFKTQSELKGAQTERLQKEKQLTIAEQEKALQQANLKLKTTELGLKEEEIQSKKLQRNIFIAGAVLLLGLGVVLVKNNRNKQKAYALLENQKLETDKQKEKLEETLTELKATQKQLIQQEKMASLGELTAGIAHEIQNPLNFVNNFSELNRELLSEMKAEMDKGNWDDAKDITSDIIDNEEKINNHGKRAEAIVKGMLQHSRSSSGKKEPTDINALADEYLRLSYHGLRAKDKSFTAHFKSDLDVSIGNINVIPQDVGRVLLNLFNNSFYSVNEKKKNMNGTFEPMVSVTTKKISNKVEIIVKDNGTGIPQKVIDKIYQPFFTTKPTGQGTGLGLSMTYDIIKGHGGEIRVETKEGEFAEFVLILPIN